MIEPATFRRVLGYYPTGVCAVTAMNGGEPAGFVVGSFTSVSLDPPLIAFFPDKKSTSWSQIEAVGKFCVNVLASDQLELCKRLATSGNGKFAGLDFALSAGGSPLFANVLAWIDCELHDVHEVGDHYAAYGRVLALDVARDASPLVFHCGQYGGFAIDVPQAF